MQVVHFGDKVIANRTLQNSHDKKCENAFKYASDSDYIDDTEYGSNLVWFETAEEEMKQDGWLIYPRDRRRKIGFMEDVFYAKCCLKRDSKHGNYFYFPNMNMRANLTSKAQNSMEAVGMLSMGYNKMFEGWFVFANGEGWDGDIIYLGQF